MRRSPLIVVVLLGLVVAGAIFFAARDRERPVAGGRPSTRPQSSFLPATAPTSASPTLAAAPSPVSGWDLPSGARTLIFVRGTRIFARDLRSATKREIGDLQSADVSAPQSGWWLAYVSPGPSGAPGNGDFVQRPELHLLDLKSGDDVTVGPGFAPLWRASGKELAYLAPIGHRSCDGETCRGRVAVNIVAPGQASRPIAKPGMWHLLAWAGNRVLAANERHLDRTVLLSSAGGAAASIPLPPSQIWDASPSGRKLLTVGSEGLAFVNARNGLPTGPVHLVQTGGSTAGDGTWSAGSGRLAAVLRKPAGGSELFFLSATRSPSPVPGSSGAVGNVVWDSAGDKLAFVAVARGDPGRLEAIVCRLTGGSASCHRVFTWTQGISLLKLEVP